MCVFFPCTGPYLWKYLKFEFDTISSLIRFANGGLINLEHSNWRFITTLLDYLFSSHLNKQNATCLAPGDLTTFREFERTLPIESSLPSPSPSPTKRGGSMDRSSGGVRIRRGGSRECGSRDRRGGPPCWVLILQARNNNCSEQFSYSDPKEDCYIGRNLIWSVSRMKIHVIVLAHTKWLALILISSKFSIIAIRWHMRIWEQPAIFGSQNIWHN